MAKIQRERLLEMEKTVLGSILVDNSVMEVCSRELETSDFSSGKHRLIYDTFMEMYGEAKPITLLSLSHEIGKENKSKVVDAGYIAGLTSGVASTGSIRYYVEEIKRASRQRKLLLVAKMAQADLEGGESEEVVVDKMESALVDISSRSNTRGYVPAHVSMMSAVRHIDMMASSGDDSWKIKTGLKQLDDLIGGLESEDYMIVGARPSVGKSALALQIAAHVAMEQKKSVVLFTLEMSGRSLMSRSISQKLRIDSKKVRQGWLSTSEIGKIIDFGSELSTFKWFINDTPNIRLTDLRAQARMVKQREGVDLIIIDYITLITGNKQLQRWEQITEISAALKQLSRELEVPVIALSQVARDSENKKPTLASLRESGAIEQDADIVLLLHRTTEPTIDLSGNPNPQGIEFILAKNRNGPVGSINMLFLPQYTRFEHATSREMDEGYQ